VLKHLMCQHAVILNEVDTTEDQYGDDVRTFTDTSGIVWDCRIEPTSSQEYETDRDTRKSFFRLFLTEQATGELTAKSRVVIDNITYEVFGDPSPMRRRSRVSHIEAIVRIIEG